MLAFTQYNILGQPWPTAVHDTSKTALPPRPDALAADKHRMLFKPDACLTSVGASPAWSNVLVAFDYTNSLASAPRQRNVQRRRIQMVSLQTTAQLLQPMRRFCFGITISLATSSPGHSRSSADIVVVTRSCSLWCRVEKIFDPCGGLPDFGALLVFLSRADPASLGCLAELSPLDAGHLYPVSDQLRLSVTRHGHDGTEEPFQVDLDLANPIFTPKQPFGRATAVFSAHNYFGPGGASEKDPSSLVAKLAWLTKDQFIDDRPIEELVLQQVKSIHPRSAASVAQLKVCHVFDGTLGNSGMHHRIPVFFVLAGRGVTMQHVPFRTVGEVLHYLDEGWRSTFFAHALIG